MARLTVTSCCRQASCRRRAAVPVRILLCRVVSNAAYTEKLRLDIYTCIPIKMCMCTERERERHRYVYIHTHMLRLLKAMFAKHGLVSWAVPFSFVSVESMSSMGSGFEMACTQGIGYSMDRGGCCADKLLACACRTSWLGIAPHRCLAMVQSRSCLHPDSQETQMKLPATSLPFQITRYA